MYKEGSKVMRSNKAYKPPYTDIARLISTRKRPQVFIFLQWKFRYEISTVERRSDTKIFSQAWSSQKLNPSGLMHPVIHRSLEKIPKEEKEKERKWSDSTMNNLIH